MNKKIAILGDFTETSPTHRALNESVEQVKPLFNEEVDFVWNETDAFNYKNAFDAEYCGLWVAPGSPYKDEQNVLKAIKYARENDIPTFGNCGGFQYMLIEFARNVCGITAADHEETNPNADDLIISKLSCSLREQQEELKIVDKTSLLFKIVGRETFTGRYFCSYGVNEKYFKTLMQKGIVFTAQSGGGEMRAFELKNQPFYLGTLFQPALTSTVESPNPLIVEFVRSSLDGESNKTLRANN